MTDVIFLVVILAFFALCVAYTRVCERIIGRDEDVVIEESSETDVEEVAMGRVA